MKICKPKPIKEIIHITVKEFKDTPYKINCGQCDQFAERVVEIMGKENYLFNGENTWPIVATEDYPYLDEYCGHIWIKYNGKHYDSETPNGANFPSELPIFVRQARTYDGEFD